MASPSEGLDLQPAHPRPESEAARNWTGRYHGKLSNGRFAIRGLAPDAEVPVYFLEPERKLGAVVNLSVKSVAGGPITVRLEPCGSARAWLVDPDGKPVAKPVREPEDHDGRDPRSRPQQFPEPERQKASLLSADEDELTTSTRSTTRNGSSPPMPLGRIDAPRPDPGRDVSLHRFHHVRPRPDRPGDPQGIHRQAGPEAHPGRYPNRQASKLEPVRLERPGPLGCRGSSRSCTMTRVKVRGRLRDRTASEVWCCRWWVTRALGQP